MFSFLKRKKVRSGLGSIEILPNGIAFAYCADLNQPSPKIQIAKFYPYQNQQLQECLTTIVKEHNLENLNCNWVLHPNDYQLILTDKPKVQPNQYKLAIRWQIKDRIDFALNDLATDIFYIPDSIIPYKNKFYVIAAQTSHLEHTSNLIKSAKLNVSSIDIRELAIRNLITTITSTNIPTSCLSFSESNSLMLFIVDENIEFVRNLRFGENALTNERDTEGLLSEIQRSLDYYHNQLKRPTIEQIFVFPPAEETPNLSQNLVEKLSTKTTLLDLSNLMNIPISADTKSLKQCTFAIGGALRKENESP